MALNQRITNLMMFHGNFIVFQSNAPTRITNKISQVVEFQLLGLFLFSKLSTFRQRSCAVNSESEAEFQSVNLDAGVA